ncbi:TetR/AcrR family transcriptional regulator [Streptomyces sp. NPDC056568]|uniref:TetR/AcrR family transcriptional regulator n=1 Tax=Streptomyces sp. NPDC056568 TaxID=3345866 RepID=UPI003687D91C
MAESSETSLTARRTAGRPRDAGLEHRALAAALELYADAGWAGFSLDTVARRAAVGKAALYRRWKNKEELLLAALDAYSLTVEPIDTGNIRDDLLAVARAVLTSYLRGSAGLAGLRLFVEARTQPELLAKSWDEVNSSRVRAARTMVRRAVERGELPPGTSATVLLEALTGGVTTHALAAPAGPGREVSADDEQFTVDLVEMILRGARCQCARPDCTG